MAGIKEVLSSPEMQKQVNMMSVSFFLTIAVALLVGGYHLGYQHCKSETNYIIADMQHDFAIDEVTGLRNDMNREVEQMQALSECQNKIQKLESQIETLKLELRVGQGR